MIGLRQAVVEGCFRYLAFCLKMDVSKSHLVTDGPTLDATGLIHRVRQPAASGPHPTVVMIHGRSGDEDVMWIFASTVPDDWLIVAPRAIRNDPNGGYSWHVRKHDTWPTLAEFDAAVDAIVRFIRALPELYAVDAHRIYLMGFSQGTALAFATALRNPGLIKGIAGLVGFVPEGYDAETVGAPLAGLPVFMAAGRSDPRIPIERARASAEILRRAGASLEYHEYETEHKLTPDAIRDLKQWWQLKK
jgi:phospholipase/carboxylesterase